MTDCSYYMYTYLIRLLHRVFVIIINFYNKYIIRPVQSQAVRNNNLISSVNSTSAARAVRVAMLYICRSTAVFPPVCIDRFPNEKKKTAEKNKTSFAVHVQFEWRIPGQVRPGLTEERQFTDSISETIMVARSNAQSSQGE